MVMKRRKSWLLLGGLLFANTVSAQPLPDLGAQGRVSSGTAFNPDISVILDGSYYHGKEEWSEAIEHVGGFINAHDHANHAHDSLAPGFNLHHAELVLSASVDPYFDAAINLGITEHGIEIEEAYGITRGLPGGLQLKMGKFFSAIGYINSQHAHDWQFTDIALPYLLLFGDHGLNEKGLQLTWTPPSDSYLIFGAEALQGENDGVANYEGKADYARGKGSSNMSGPRLFTGFAKFAPDLGFDHALQMGVFAGHARQHQELNSSLAEEGTSWFAGTDWVYKYDPGGHFGYRSLTLQAEYIYRVRELEVVGTRAGLEARLGEQRTDTQDGFYIQGVYGIAPRWLAGLRYEIAGITNKREWDDSWRSWNSSERVSANLTWLPTEFSRLRLQYSQSQLADEDTPATHDYHQIFLQYQLALGVHGAHRF